MPRTDAPDDVSAIVGDLQGAAAAAVNAHRHAGRSTYAACLEGAVAKLAGDARRHSETIDGIECPGKQTVPNSELDLRGSQIIATFRTESGYRQQDCSGHGEFMLIA